MRCGTHINWKSHLPECLIHLGAYQSHLNPDKTIPKNAMYKIQPAEYVEDIFINPAAIKSAAPALQLKSNLDGTRTPSNAGLFRPAKEEVLNDIAAHIDQDKNLNINLSKNLFSNQAAPTMGQFNNLSAPLFMEYDPKVTSKFKGVVYIGMATSTNDVIMRNKKLRNTKFDPTNDSAWHYQDNTEFEIIKIVKSGASESPVEYIDDLNAIDEG